MLSETEAKKRIKIALDNARNYIENEQNFVFNKEKIEECLKNRSEYLGLNQKIYWLMGLSEKSLKDLRSSLWSSLWSSLGSSFSFIWWDSEYLAANDKELKEYSKFMKEAIQNGLGFVCDFEKAIIIIPMPKFSKDERRRLHNLEKEAVLWADDFKQFYLDGINLSENIHKKVREKSATFQEIMAIENMEQRMVCFKYLGQDWLLRETKAQKIDQNDRGDVLYQIDGIISKPIKLAKYLDWSTDRVYLDFVLPEHIKIDEALAWKHHFSIEQWREVEHA